MRVSTSLRTGYLVDDFRMGARCIIERAAVSAEAGLDGLYVGDQHVTPIPYYQNTAILGRVLAEWDDRPTGALYLLPLWHPVLVAEQVGTLASIAAGPFVLQCAVGGHPHQFAAMGADMRRRARDFEAGLDVIVALLRGDTVTTDAPIPIQGAQVCPRPESFRVWIGADAETGIGRAARLADAWYGNAGLTAAEAKDKIAYYRQRMTTEGRTPEEIPIRRDVHVAGSAAEAEDVRARLEQTGHRGFDLSALVVGTPDEVAAEFAHLRDLGFTEVVTRQIVDDQSAAVASIRRLAAVREILAG
jgi:alkanesulfonate monooxygenase SsuD/methylene tetrahydromethanopterin reductase-like flavin-dependent oxidoreductase (luciferase family)